MSNNEANKGQEVTKGQEGAEKPTGTEPIKKEQVNDPNTFGGQIGQPGSGLGVQQGNPDAHARTFVVIFSSRRYQARRNWSDRLG